MIRKMGDYLFRYRYPLALCLFILGILLEFTGSSIGMWNTYYDMEDTGVLWGESRDIRMDEWATLTPFVWSQYFGDNPFSYFSSIVRGTSTDVFLEYGTPVMSLAMLFRPFYLGYLFLPIAKGMAFFWCGRIIALFMASFEFGRILTKDRRGIALIYGLFITFAPVVQWWFSTNGFVEMLIAMQLAVVLLWKYMEVDSYKKKIACMIGIGICAGTFILTMYPSWMVPLAYVLIILIIWTFYEHRDNFRIKSGDVVIVATIIVITGIGVLFILLKSKETIDLLANTAYPGARLETGGGAWNQFTGSLASMFFDYDYPNSIRSNVCEDSLFWTFFPMGIILYFYNIYKNRKGDFLSHCFMVLIVFFGIWCFVGFPETIAQITFMSNSQAGRALVIFSLLNFLLLIRLLAVGKLPQWNKWISLICCGCLSIAVVYMCYVVNPGFFGKKKLFILLVVMFLAFYGIMQFYNDKIKVCLGLLSCGIVFVSGIVVNPFRFGVDDIQSIEELQMVSDVLERDEDGLWIVEGSGYPYTNSLLLVGAKTLNSTNVYPNLSIWSKIDESGEYEDIYNRYAHISINLVEDAEETFQLLYPDQFAVNLSEEDLETLGVDYIYTQNTFENEDYKLIDCCNEWNIYQVMEN